MQPLKRLSANVYSQSSNDRTRLFLVGSSTNLSGSILLAGRTKPRRNRIGAQLNDRRHLHLTSNSNRRLSENCNQEIFQFVRLRAHCSCSVSSAKHALLSTTFAFPSSALRKPFSGASRDYSTSAAARSLDLADIDEAEVVEKEWTRLFQGMIPLK